MRWLPPNPVVLGGITVPQRLISTHPLTPDRLYAKAYHDPSHQRQHTLQKSRPK